MATSLFSYLHFFSLLVYIFLVGLIIYLNPKSHLNRISAAFLACFVIWSFGNIFIHTPGVSLESTIILNNINAIGWIFFSSFFIWFALLFTKKEAILKKWYFYAAIFAPALFFYILQLKGYMLVDYIATPYGRSYSWHNSFWHYLFYLYYISLLLISIYSISRFREKEEARSLKKHIRVLNICLGIALVLGSITNVFLQELNIHYLPPIADSLALIWAIGLAYLIVKYKFLVITPALAAEKIISTMSDALIILDMNGKIITINKAALILIDSKQSEIIGQSFSRIIEEKSFEGVLLANAQKGIVIESHNLHLRTSRKKSIPVIFSNSILEDDYGNKIGIVGTARDITQLEKAEDEMKKRAILLEEKVRELKASQKSLTKAYTDLTVLQDEIAGEHKKTVSIIENFVDPVIVLNKTDQIDLVNPAAERIFGFDNECLGKKIKKDNDFSMDNFNSIIAREYEVKHIHAANPGEKGYEEVRIYYKGQQYVYKVTTVKIFDENKKDIGTMKIFNDLTREKMIDQLKSEFISVAAHQLRTPLSAVKWVLRMALDGDVGSLSKELRAILKKGYQSNERIINLINDMLNVSHIEEGKFGLVFAKEDLLEIIDRTVDRYIAEIRASNIKLKISKPNKLKKVYVDKEKIQIALANIIKNAITYTPEYGTIQIIVSASKDYVKISVKDNGVGVPEKDKIKVFSKFFRASNVIRMKTDGSGLGLYISKNIISRHGGRVTFESAEGKGTEFICLLPFEKK